ncbi:plasmid-related protein [Pseudomonas tremae]|nr:plasmid-related protein [Pseudomonas tremae]MCQ2991006.1 plasmid-related protein [Pseudomonas tremae]
MTTEQYLLHQFGPLMTLPDLAKLLGRSTDGVRVSLYADSEISRALRSTMIKIGRRIYFRTSQVNTVLHLEAPSSEQ